MDMPLLEVLKHTITYNMTKSCRAMVRAAMEENPEAAIKMIEEILSDRETKGSVFVSEKTQPTQLDLSTKPTTESTSEYGPKVRPSKPTYPKKQHWSPKPRRRDPGFTPHTCSYWFSQRCNFGENCWNIHSRQTPSKERETGPSVAPSE